MYRIYTVLYRYMLRTIVKIEYLFAESDFIYVNEDITITILVDIIRFLKFSQPCSVLLRI